jgi:alpha-D-xyloside xylohydrolase
MNYKTYQVQLFQNNTEVVVPFLVSKKNYGILWDNYSFTKFGDVRAYQPLSAMKLFSKDGDQGWLTASYNNDVKNPSKLAIQRPESTINYEFLGDSRLFLPKEFKPATGVATWEGNIASGVTGIHKFRFSYAGYLKVWIDNKLVLDRWRQNWNPGSAILIVELQK